MMKSLMKSFVSLVGLIAMLMGSHALAEGSDQEAASPTSVFCISPTLTFSIESPAQWKFDETQSLTNGRCVAFTRIFDSTSAEIAVYTFASKPAGDVVHMLTGIAATDLPEIEQRKGDPLSVAGMDFSVLKYFPKGTGFNFVTVASAVSNGNSVYVTLSAPDRAAHDRFYQMLRDTIRTIRLPNAAGVSH